MKKGFFKSLFASFSIATCVIFALFLTIMVLAGIGAFADIPSIVDLKPVIQGFSLTYILCISLAGLTGLKDSRISFFDFARFTAFIGGFLGLIISIFIARPYLSIIEIIYFTVNCVVILVQLIFRIINVKEDSDYSGTKAFVSSFVAKFDFLIVLAGILLVSTIVILFFNYDVNFFERIRDIIVGVAVGYMLVQIVIIKTVKNNKANFVDIATIMGIMVIGMAVAFDSKDIPTRSCKILLIIVIVMALMFFVRAIIYKGKPIEPTLGTSKYYKSVLLKYDVVGPISLAFIVVFILVAPNNTLVDYLFVKIHYEQYLPAVVKFSPFIVLAFVIINGVIVSISRGFRSNKPRLTDYALTTMLLFAVFSLPYVMACIFQAKTLGGILKDNPTTWCSVIAVVVNLIAVCILLPNRISSFNYDYEADAKEFLDDDEEFFVDYEYKKNNASPEGQEIDAEDSAEPKVKPFDLSEFEFDESLINAPVVNQLPQYDLDADAEFLAYMQAMEEQGTPINLDDVEYEEQIVYVDEFGNEVEGPFDYPEDEEVIEEEIVHNLDDNAAQFIRDFGSVNAEGEQSVEAALEFIRQYEKAMGITHVEDLQVEQTAKLDSDGEEEDDDDYDNDNDNEDLEPEDDGTPVEEELLSDSNTREKNIIIPEFQILDENGAPKKIKRKFSNRMMFAPLEAKEYYNEIKNYFMMYRATSRYSARCETYRYKGLIAKVSLAGKSIKVNLALNPSDLEGTKYKFKDVSMKKQYVEVPVMIKVRSQRGLKHFKELVDYMMAARLVQPKANFTPVDYLPQLVPNGESILATIGLSTDYLYNSINVRGIPSDLPDNLEDYLPVIPAEPIEGEPVEAVVYIDTLSLNFNDGDIITLETLKELHVIDRGNILHIKARGTLDRKITVYADKFDSDALKMLMCTNCIAVKVSRQ